MLWKINPIVENRKEKKNLLRAILTWCSRVVPSGRLLSPSRRAGRWSGPSSRSGAAIRRFGLCDWNGQKKNKMSEEMSWIGCFLLVFTQVKGLFVLSTNERGLFCGNVVPFVRFTINCFPEGKHQKSKYLIKPNLIGSL